LLHNLVYTTKTVQQCRRKIPTRFGVKYWPAVSADDFQPGLAVMGLIASRPKAALCPHRMVSFPSISARLTSQKCTDSSDKTAAQRPLMSRRAEFIISACGPSEATVADRSDMRYVFLSQASRSATLPKLSLSRPPVFTFEIHPTPTSSWTPHLTTPPRSRPSRGS
jgi:hypothetical protein